jgi:dephospho-CoA kinase
MLIVGLTGGIGAGKTTVGAMLQEYGAAVVDVDALGRKVLELGGRAYAGVVAAFGESILDSAGLIDRSILSREVFADPQQLHRLTQISHPAINQELAEKLDSIVGVDIVVLDIAILAESNLGRGDPGHTLDVVVTVEAPTELRVQRAVGRGMPETEVRRRISSQATDAERRRLADYVLVNDGDRASLESQVNALWLLLHERRRGGGEGSKAETRADMPAGPRAV